MNPYLKLGTVGSHTAAETPAPPAGNIVQHRRIRVDDLAAPIPLPGVTSGTEPRVELVREGGGGVVRSIIVRCTCGCSIQLVCEYE